MDIFYKIIALLGGLSMFLYGMRVMGDGLKRSSGGAMKRVLSKAVSRPIIGFLLGAFITCVIQSSTAAIVLTVGLVGAGFLTFRQSIGIVLGANVGTAITAQIIRLMDIQAGTSSLLYFFKADNLAPIALIIGIILIMFSKKNSSKNVGSIACGLGVLFMGLIFMSSAVNDMREPLTNVLTAFENNYLLGFFAGVGVTGIIQSSSAVVGILQSLASSVGVQFCGVFATIIGVNIGDCLTTYLVCRIGANEDQRRAVLVHIIYNVFAAVLIILVILAGRLTGIITDDFWTQTLDSGGVANVHGVFRLVPAVLLLPLTNVFANIAEKIVKDKKSDSEDDENEEKLLGLLAPHLIQSPVLALEQVQTLIGHMGDIALHNYDAATKQIYGYDFDREARIDRREDLLDKLTDASNQYIVQISSNVTSERDNKNQNYQIKALTCFERIGDLSVDIAKNASVMMQAGKQFSENADTELGIAISAVTEILSMTLTMYKTNDGEIARKVEPLEEVIDDLMRDLQARHINRMTHKLCNVPSGIQYQNLLQNLERISDQCSDLAVYLLEQTDEAILGKEHQYLHNLHHSDNPEYRNAFQESYQKYFGMIENISSDQVENSEVEGQQTMTEELN